MSDRGMKKWLPFNALVEQNEYLEKLIYEKNKIKKPQVSTEQARKIDTILKSYSNQKLNFNVYYDGYLYHFTGLIKKIDLNKKVIFFDDFYIPIKDIVDIEQPNVFDDIC